MILPIHRERLLALADFLDKLPVERFDYRLWVGSDWDGNRDLSCGTTACALGWATTMPLFQSLGLGLIRFGTSKGDEVVPVLVVERLNAPDEVTSSPHAIIHRLFGDYPGVTRLFFPQSEEAEMGPGEVAEKIRIWVKYQERVEEE